MLDSGFPKANPPTNHSQPRAGSEAQSLGRLAAEQERLRVLSVARHLEQAEVLEPRASDRCSSSSKHEPGLADRKHHSRAELALRTVDGVPAYDSQYVLVRIQVEHHVGLGRPLRRDQNVIIRVCKQ